MPPVAPFGLLNCPPPVIVLASKGSMSQSAKSEWALVMTFFLLFSLFAAEFRCIECHRLTVYKQVAKKNQSSDTSDRNTVT